jgi:hypothetical protein
MALLFPKRNREHGSLGYPPHPQRLIQLAGGDDLNTRRNELPKETSCLLVGKSHESAFANTCAIAERQGKQLGLHQDCFLTDHNPRCVSTGVGNPPPSSLLDHLKPESARPTNTKDLNNETTPHTESCANSRKASDNASMKERKVKDEVHGILQ